jgi:hypothetical protein
MSFWVRQTHRWLAMIFTLTVIANFAVFVLPYVEACNAMKA